MCIFIYYIHYISHYIFIIYVTYIMSYTFIYIYIYKEGNLLHKMEKCVTVTESTYNTKSKFHQLFQKVLLMIIRHRQWEKENTHSLLFLLPLQQNPHLSIAPEGLLRSSSATANLHTSCKVSLWHIQVLTNPNLWLIQDIELLLEDFKTDKMW